MKNKLTLLLLLFFCSHGISAKVMKTMNEPDSAYLFAYATDKNTHHNGLHFAWSIDGWNTWYAIGPEHRFLGSDYGTWGPQKRMLDPVVFQDKDGLWRCLFSVNEKDGVVANASSADLINWRPQSYPILTTAGNCGAIEVGYSTPKDEYCISWVSKTGTQQGVYGTTTKDFHSFTPVIELRDELYRINQRVRLLVDGKYQTGTIHKVSWQTIDELIKAHKMADYKRILHSEKMADDPTRFASLKPVQASITINPEQSKSISDMLIGIFFEDINYAADGGLYAELVQNRDFEYDPSDKKGSDPQWNSTKAWSLQGDAAAFTIDTINPIHANNPHYALLHVERVGAALVNEGFDGIPVKAGDKYIFSLFARNPQGKGGEVRVRVIDAQGKSCGEATVKCTSSTWKKQEVVITATRTATNATLELMPQSTGTLHFDMISLFPQKTFKGHRNGLRPDLAQTLADMKPRFIRFPGGCVAHGDGLDNMYRWKNTIGALEARKPQRNIWNYHQTAGLGYFEYFQFCEDIGAEPLPVLPAGVPCQNSSHGGHGQQCGIPMSEMQDYIQEVLDLIEWANGDAKSTWGKKRAEAGHPKPFNLKYIGIGNEDLISDVFEERYAMICKAVQAKYPEMIIIGTVGPFYEGSDYEEGWRIATELGLQMVDEHYYESPGWYIHNQQYYDRYDRSKPKVYLGEYAAHLPGRPSNIETSLAEALHLANVERNGDVVSLTSYAPLLAKEGNTQWTPDLIYFNNTEVKPTVDYYVQMLYGQNAGDTYIPSRMSLSDQSSAVTKRMVTSVVRDSRTGDYIVKMVNLLPVAVKTKLDLKPLGALAAEATYTVLSGRPNDKLAKPVTGTVSISDTLEGEVPAYSFCVLRVKSLR